MRLYFIPQIQALKVSYDITPSQHLTEVYDKAALNLLYSDQRADYPRPLYAHEVEIGFLFPEIVQPVLPSEVSEFIGEDKNVIVVSFGSQIGKLSDKFIDVAVEIFTRMPYKVIIRANDFSQSYTNILAMYMRVLCLYPHMKENGDKYKVQTCAGIKVMDKICPLSP